MFFVSVVTAPLLGMRPLLPRWGTTGGSKSSTIDARVGPLCNLASLRIKERVVWQIWTLTFL